MKKYMILGPLPAVCMLILSHFIEEPYPTWFNICLALGGMVCFLCFAKSIFDLFVEKHEIAKENQKLREDIKKVQSENPVSDNKE